MKSAYTISSSPSPQKRNECHIDPEWGLQILQILSSFLMLDSPEADPKPWSHMQIFIKEVFLGETGKGVEEKTRENVILGKVLTSARCYQGDLEHKLHLYVPTLDKGEELQTSVLVIGSGLLGQGGYGE